MKISKEFSIDSAHVLNLPYPSKCNRLHGHTYKVDLVFDGDLDENGMIVDYANFPDGLVMEADHKTIIPARFVQHDGARLNILIEPAASGPQHFKTVLNLSKGAVYIIEQTQSTAENLAQHFGRKIRSAGFPIWSVMVSETPKTKAVWYAYEDPEAPDELAKARLMAEQKVQTTLDKV